VPLSWSYAGERWFHAPAVRTFVGTRSLIAELREHGVGRQHVYWPRGVDARLFDPARRQRDMYACPRPIWLYAGRVAIEKNLDAFLSLAIPGTKVVVGDGPARAALQSRYPGVVWTGWRHGEDLAAHIASADCFVFPSRTETFGNVVLEALASGLPVAAVPAPGPLDLIEDGINGALGEDLAGACMRAYGCSRVAARRTALKYDWKDSHEIFKSHLVPLRPGTAARGRLNRAPVLEAAHA
jgi:glycosyltransferase involved in cell wall biosynthesis